MFVPQQTTSRNCQMINKPLFSAVPSAPQAPSVTNPTSNSIHLNWTAPSDDGGAPVLGYYVERSTNESDRWLRINRDMLGRLQYDQSDLIEGTTYQYRIVAVNKKGDSAPSEPSPPYVCKPQIGMLPAWYYEIKKYYKICFFLI